MIDLTLRTAMKHIEQNLSDRQTSRDTAGVGEEKPARVKDEGRIC